jgi:hypothetical protein
VTQCWIHDRGQDLAADARYKEIENRPEPRLSSHFLRLHPKRATGSKKPVSTNSDGASTLLGATISQGMRSGSQVGRTPRRSPPSRVLLLATHLWCRHSIFSKDSLAVVCVG